MRHLHGYSTHRESVAAGQTGAAVLLVYPGPLSITLSGAGAKVQWTAADEDIIQAGTALWRDLLDLGLASSGGAQRSEPVRALRVIAGSAAAATMDLIVRGRA